MSVLIDWASEALEILDAGLFTGDTFHSEAALKELDAYLVRWQKQIYTIRQELVEDNNQNRRFPIQGGTSIPWEMIAPHEARCQRNHCQTLTRIAERGGFSHLEALAVLDDRSLHDAIFSISVDGLDEAKRVAKQELERRCEEYEKRSEKIGKPGIHGVTK